MNATEVLDGPSSRVGTARILAVIVSGSAAAASLGGLAWGLLAPAQQLLVVAQGRGAALTGESLHRFDALALFSLISVTLGVLLPVGWWLWESERGPRMFVAVLLGAFVGSATAAVVGNGVAALRFPSVDDPVIGSVITVAPEMWSPLVLIVQALTASLVVVLLAAMNPHDDLRSTEEIADLDPLDLDPAPPPPSFDSRLTN